MDYKAYCPRLEENMIKINFISNMASSFYHFMTEVRDAIPIELDNTLQIVDAIKFK